MFEPKVLPKPVIAEPPQEKRKAPKKFLVTVSATAQVQMDEEVEAENQREAKRLAEERVRERKPDFSKKEVKIRVRRVKAVQS